MWLGRQALHAARLTLRHPETNEEIRLRRARRRTCEGVRRAGADPDAW